MSESSLSIGRHIVVVVTDGASAKVIFGWCVDCEHQLCYAHAMHLAVYDALYRKQTFHEADVADVLEENDCQETDDLRSGINIEHDQNEEQAESDIRSDLV